MVVSCQQALLTRVLLFGASPVPIDNTDELPVIFVELKLKLAIFVDDQLRSWVEKACALSSSESFKSNSPAVKLKAVDLELL
jgi:hypothetical protein